MFFGGHPGMGEEQTAQPGQKQQVNTTEYYEMLEVGKDATTQQIKKAFRKKALKEHPDRGGDPERFRRLKDASEALSDPEKRQLYDEYGEEGVKNGGPPGQGGSFFDMFNSKQRDNKPKKMKPKLVKVEVTLEQVYTGTMKQITVTRYRVCIDCEGKGGSNPKKCQQCKGNGVQLKVVQIAPGMMTQAQVPCEKCEGTGEMMSEEDKCKTCAGKKVKEQEKIIQVAVEPGVPDSHDYTFCGEADEIPGILAGDIFARVTIVKHDVFERRGADLAYTKQISLLEALTGVTTTLKLLDGKEYTIATAPGEVLQHKELKTIRNLGMPFYQDSMSHGNLYFEFVVVFPQSKSLNNGQEKAIRQAFAYASTNAGLDKKEGAIPLDDYSEELLNPKCKKAKDEEQEEEDGEEGEGQGVQCQGQ